MTPHKIITNFNAIIETQKTYSSKRVALSVAQSKSGITAVNEAYNLGIAEPVLFGNKELIYPKFDELGIDRNKIEIFHYENYLEAAHSAAKYTGEGKADILMKGHLHSDDYLRTIINKENKLLLPGNLLSHVFVLESLHLNRLLLVTDAGINIAPNLEKKARIAANAIFLSQVLGVEEPKVAALSTIEVVNPAIPSSIEAALLAKMSDRNQIRYGKIDGPFALDNAINIRAAKEKQIESDVAGNADILLVPNIETGNALAKSFVYLAKGDTAGLVLGAQVPVVLPSRSDTAKSKLMGLILGALVSDMVQEKFVKLGKVHV